MHIPRYVAGILSMAAVGFMAPQAARCQSTEEADVASQRAQGTLLEEVIVRGYRVQASTSATGIVTDLIDTPISITAITGEFLQDTRSTQIMDALGAMTGVTGQSNSGETGTNLAVRGFRVQPQVDGFNTLNPASGLGSSIGVERIEVVKGPSAVFNGNVPPGGSVNIIYAKPSFERKNSIGLAVGSWDYKTAELMSTGPLFSDKLAYYVHGFYKDAGGWVNYTSQEESTILAGITYQPWDSTSLTLNYRRWESDNGVSTMPASHTGFIGSGFPVTTPLDAWVAAVYGPNEPPLNISIPDAMPDGRRDNVLGPQNRNRNETEMATAELSVRVNEHFELRNNFMYNTYRWRPLAVAESGIKSIATDGQTVSPLTSFLLAGTIGETGWENKLEGVLTFDTGAVSHALLIGYDTAYREADIQEAFLALPPMTAPGVFWNFWTNGPRMLQDELDARLAQSPVPNIGIYNYSHDRTNAFYAVDQISMLENRLRFLVGARYTETKFSNLAWPSDQKVDDTTPQIGVVFRPFPADSDYAETAIFVNYSESFTPQSLLQPATGEMVPPAEGEGFEVGLKTDWFNGALSSTVSWFRNELKNIATPDYSGQGQNGTIVAYHLGGVGKTEGAELEVTWTPSSAAQLTANFTYLPTAKYTAYPDTPQMVGLRFGSTPEEQWNLIGRYAIQSDGVWDGAYFGAWVHGQSETRGTLGSDWKHNVHLPSLVQADAFFGYRYKNWDGRLNIKNLTDRGGNVMNNVFLANPPRAVYLSLKLDF